MDLLFEKERLARMANDFESLLQIQMEIIQNCRSEDEVITALKALQNKRKQNIECIRRIVRKIFDDVRQIGSTGHSETIRGIDIRPEIFLTRLLDEILAGKMDLEKERVDVTEFLSNILPISQSYKMLIGVPVETFTSVDEEVKNRILLKQMDYSLRLKEYSESEVILRKFRRSGKNKEYLKREIRLKVLLEQYLEGSKKWYAFFEKESVAGSAYASSVLLDADIMAAFCLISSSLTEKRNIVADKREMVEKFHRSKEVSESMRKFVELFKSRRIIQLSQVGGILERIKDVLGDIESDDAGSSEGGLASLFLASLRLAVMEHNFYIVISSFSTISVDNMTRIMGISQNDSAEGDPQRILIDFITKMVNEKYCAIKINQCNSMVNLGEKSWSKEVNQMLDDIIRANHIIEMENINKSDF